MSKERKWRLTLTEPQLRLIAQCVEDCSLFASGQTGLDNTICCLRHWASVEDVLWTIRPIVAPDLGIFQANYGWNGGSCPHEQQRKFIAETYYLYREILHQITMKRSKEDNMMLWDVYFGETLRCADSGEPIKLEVVDETDQD